MTHDGRQPIAIGHLSDSGDLKMRKIFRQMNEHTNSQITHKLTDNKSKQVKKKFSFELSDSGSSNELF